MLSFLKKLLGFPQTDFAALIEEGAIIIDVRTPEEFSRGHAKGTMNIPLQELGEHIGDIKKQAKPVITCCRSGARASRANGMLKKAGIEAHNAGSWSNVKTFF